MALDWLLGPRESRTDFDTIEIRPLVIEPDTVREIYQMIEDVSGAARLRRINFEAQGNDPVLTDLDIGELETIPDWMRRRLQVTDGSGVFFNVVLHERNRPTVQVIDAGMAGQPDDGKDWAALYRDLQRRIVEKLYNEGKRRLSWALFAWLTPWLGWALLVAAWIWFVVSQSPNLALAIVGSLLVLAAAASAHVAADVTKRATGYRGVGMSIKSLNRQDIRRRRADRHANLRVAAITIPSGAFAGALVTLIFNR